MATGVRPAPPPPPRTNPAPGIAPPQSWVLSREFRTLPFVYGTGKARGIPVYKGPVQATMAGWRWLDDTDDDIHNPAWKSVGGSAATVVLAVCEAPIAEFTKAYRDGVTLAAADFYRLNDTYFGNSYIKKIAVDDVALGSSVLVGGGHPADLALMTLKDTAYYGAFTLFLNEDSSIPDISFEVRGMCLSGAAVNAHPADVVIDLLTNTRYGLGLPASAIVTDVGLDGLATSSYRNCCTAVGWAVSRVIEGGEDAGDLLASLLFCTDAVLVQSEGKLKIIPRRDTAITANGATYTPPATAAVLNADEILKDPGQDPITVERTPDDQVFNCFPVRIRNRAADYKESEYETEDTTQPTRKAPAVDGSWLPDAVQAARLSSLLVRRSVYARNLYRFRIKGKWAALEVMDYVSISEPVTGLSNVLCRIESIRRLKNGDLEIAAREAPEGSATPVDYTPQTEDGYSQPLIPLSIGAVGEGVTAVTTLVNTKTTTYQQSAAPAGPNTVGDLWFDSDDGNKPYRWDGAAWVSAQDGSIALVGGGSTTYVQATAPTGDLIAGDLWFESDAGNKLYRWNGSSWVVVQDAGAAAGATANKTYIQTSQPTGGTYVAGDLWFDSDDGNKPYRWDGAAWVAIQDASIATKVPVGGAAADINGNGTTVSGTKITDQTVGGGKFKCMMGTFLLGTGGLPLHGGVGISNSQRMAMNGSYGIRLTPSASMSGTDYVAFVGGLGTTNSKYYLPKVVSRASGYIDVMFMDPATYAWVDTADANIYGTWWMFIALDT